MNTGMLNQPPPHQFLHRPVCFLSACSFVCLFICLSVHLSVCSFLSLFVCLSVHLSVCSFASLFICICLSYLFHFICPSPSPKPTLTFPNIPQFKFLQIMGQRPPMSLPVSMTPISSGNIGPPASDTGYSQTSFFDQQFT